jgi:hypothetical protein
MFATTRAPPSLPPIPITKQRVRFLLNEITRLADPDDILGPLRQFLNETLAALEKKRVIGLVGRLATGKSTIINSILGFELLPTYFGATTTVPTQIHRIAGDRYFLEVHYLDKAETREMFATLIDELKPQEDREVVRLRLETLLTLPDPLTIESTITPSPFMTPAGVTTEGIPIPLAELIGRPCRTLEAGSLEGLREIIVRETDYHSPDEAYDEEPVSRLKHALKHLVIKGPFDALPEDVILVDTPGLNDDDGTNSARTWAVLPTFDEMWLVTDYRTAMNEKVDTAVLRQFYGARGPNIRIIPTAGNANQNRGYDVLVQRLWRRLCQNDEAVIPIDFCPNAGDGDAVDRWRVRLEQIHVDQQENVARLFALAVSQLDRIGGTVSFPPNWEVDFINQILALFPALPLRGQLPPEYSSISNWWDTPTKKPKKKSTIGAVMTPIRCGVFKEHNLNVDLAILWFNWCRLFVSRLEAEILKWMTDLSNSLGAEYHDYLSSQWRRLLDALTFVSGEYFANTSQLIQYQLYYLGVYSWQNPDARKVGRYHLPTEDEFLQVIGNVLLPRARQGIPILVNFIREVRRMLPPPLAERMRTHLLELFTRHPPYPIEEPLPALGELSLGNENAADPWYVQLWAEVWAAAAARAPV